MNLNGKAAYCGFAIVVFTMCIQVSGLNLPRLYRACRVEDGFHRCTNNRKCQGRVDIFRTYCESERVVCTNDEFTCRSLNRCIPRSIIGTDNGCLFGKKGITTLPCRDDEFTCGESRLCLPRYLIRNGKDDCSLKNITDTTDEIVPLSDCVEELEFRCPDDSQQCIPREWILDGPNDCISGADEKQALAACNHLEFRCKDTGRCLLKYRVSDGHNDCEDGSDETKPFDMCFGKTEFRCKSSGRCIPRSWVMDGIQNCPDNSDEDVASNFTCVEGEFRCQNGRRCLPLKYTCDGMNHCGDCSDEVEACDEQRMWRCPGNSSICIPQAYGCDGFPDCPGGKDNPEYLPGFKCPKTVLGSEINQCVIPQWTLHDNHSYCEDQSDLCFKNGSFECERCLADGSIISKRQLCDGIIDCRDLSDECLCNSHELESPISNLCDSICYNSVSSQACDRCEINELHCPEDNKCVRLNEVCNGVVDCPVSRMDEKLCTKDDDIDMTEEGNKDFDCWDIGEDIMELMAKVNVLETFYAVYKFRATKCDGVVECSRFEDECAANCTNEIDACKKYELLHISPQVGIVGDRYIIPLRACRDFGQVSTYDYTDFLIGESLCNGIQECTDKADEENCTGQFECNAGSVEIMTGALKNRISIPTTEICDGKSNCLDQSDEMGCNTSTHFYCTSKNPLYIPKSKVMDGVQDCDDNTDECPPFAYDNNPFSSREEMIGNQILRAFIWIMATVALIGNLLVILETLYSEWLKRTTSMSRCNRILILNLALSDFMMGVALIIIGISSTEMSGGYCLLEKRWRVGSTCDTIGVLTVLSSETSVYSLVALTSYRLYGIFLPFKSRNVRPNRALIVAGTTWALSLTLALIPLIPGPVRQSMVNDALTSPSVYFKNTVVSWKDIQSFAIRLNSLVPQNQTLSNDLQTWESVVANLKDNYADHAPEVYGYFGYYSAHGVCIPRLFRTEGTPPLHPMSLMVISINFCSLIFIVIAYVMIYRKTTHRKVGASAISNEEQTRSVQRKITILIATDFCCWLPICIMTFISESGVYISGIGYAVAAIILLPINSSLNPIIYSGGFAITRDAIFRKSSSLGVSIQRRMSRKTPLSHSSSNAPYSITGSSGVSHSTSKT